MVLLSTHQHLAEQGIRDAAQGMCELVFQQKRFGLLAGNESDSEKIWNVLEVLEEAVCSRNGQYVTLDAHDISGDSLASCFLAALETWRDDRPFRINLPDIFRHDPDFSSIFINRAILWQRLGDRLIEEDEPERPTVLVLKNFDLLDAKMQHDFARLVRFHATHRIRRTFLITTRRENVSFIKPEILAFVGTRLEI